MGFSNKTQEGGSGKYANFKKGKIVTKIDGEQKTFTTISGSIVDISISEETYQNKPYDKLTVWIAHEDGCTQLGFPFLSGYGRAFCKILPNVDPKKQVEISGGIKELDGGNTYGTMFIRQDDKPIKWYFTKANENEKGHKLPEVKTTKVGRQDVKDTTDLDNFLQKVIMGWLEKKCRKIYPEGAKPFLKTFKESDKEDSDLPFDQEEAPF